eukprot:2696245-Amphidinium_carterae.1
MTACKTSGAERGTLSYEVFPCLIALVRKELLELFIRQFLRQSHLWSTLSSTLRAVVILVQSLAHDYNSKIYDEISESQFSN